MCKKEDVSKVVLEAFRKASNNRSVDEQYSVLFDLGFDSIDVTEVIMEIEECFDIDIDADDIVDCRTVGETIDKVWEIMNR